MGQANWKRKQQVEKFQSIDLGQIFIIEWLAPNETLTGSFLATRLSNSLGSGVNVTLVKCFSKNEVFDALQRAKDEIPTHGVPIVHIEAHGSLDRDGFIGPNVADDEIIEWHELRQPLRDLNVASDFNLMIVGAACLSAWILTAVEPYKPAPFLAVVAFNTTVYARTMLDSLSELYRCLFVEKLRLEDCVDRANRELASDERLGFTPVPVLVRSAAKDLLGRHATRDAFMKYWEGMYLKSILVNGRRPTPLELKNFVDKAAPRQIEAMLSAMFLYDLFPQNKGRFGFNAEMLARDIWGEYYWSV